jgi:hypothetical protein
MMTKISYRGYRFPPEIIQHAIWLYIRFTLNFRDIEDLLAERGIMVSHETVRRWVNHFGPAIAADLRKRRPKPHSIWHLDEVYLWRAVDAEGEVLHVLLQTKRNKRAALKLMRKLLKKPGLFRTNWLRTSWHPTAPPAGILGWQTGTNAAGHATTGRRIRISPPVGGSARCNASKAWAQPKDFSPSMLPPTTPSTSNATSFRLKRTAPSGLRLWRHGIKPLARHEQRCAGRVITLIVRQPDSASSMAYWIQNDGGRNEANLPRPLGD